jgi:hypothetical protein
VIGRVDSLAAVPQGKNLPVALTGRLGNEASLCAFRENKILALAAVEPQFGGHPAHSLVTKIAKLF